MADVPRRIEIGFEGGQVIAMRVPEAGLTALRSALEKGGWHRVETDEAEIDVDLGKVAFLKTVVDSQKVGF